MREPIGDICPCQRQQAEGLAKTYSDCCQPYHQGQQPESYEALMRSRYSAYVLGLAKYLAETWHSSTRPANLNAQPDDQWLKLDIVKAHGTQVHFRAYSQDENGFQCMEEVSNFTEESGRKVYVDGNVQMTAYTPARNEPCLCGSGKKYKKCCGR